VKESLGRHQSKMKTRRRSESAYVHQVHDNVIMYTSTCLHARLPSECTHTSVGLNIMFELRYHSTHSNQWDWVHTDGRLDGRTKLKNITFTSFTPFTWRT